MHFVDAKGILTGSGGHYGMNIYRGCTHGCIYCDSRSRCYQFTHPFEDIEVKQKDGTVKVIQKYKRKKRFGRSINRRAPARFLLELKRKAEAVGGVYAEVDTKEFKVMNTLQGYICNSRPRRFGKSITANMLTAYYSKGCDSQDLFAGLKISEASDFKKHLNQYDVIHLDIQLREYDKA